MTRRGFTLVELLTTSAVIAVLIGLAMPVFSRTRATRERAACLVNLRSIGQATEAYRGDHAGLLPFADRPVDLRAGWADPIRALASYLDAPTPRAGATASPWACPSDNSTASSLGWSYWYTPHDLMSMLPRAFAQRLATAWLERDSSVVIIHDAHRFHTGASPLPLTGMNCLRLDGGVEAGRVGLSINPKR